MPSERLFDLLGLARTQEPGVHEHARQLIADGPVHQECRDARVHPAGQGAVDLCVAHGGADPLDGIVDDVGRRPVGEQPAPVHQESLHDGLPVRCVRHLGVELDGEQGPVGIFHAGDRDLVGRCRDAEPLRSPDDGVPVGHPDGVGHGEVPEEEARLRHVQDGCPVLALPCRRDLAAQGAQHTPEHPGAQRHRLA